MEEENRIKTAWEHLKCQNYVKGASIKRKYQYWCDLDKMSQKYENSKRMEIIKRCPMDKTNIHRSLANRNSNTDVMAGEFFYLDLDERKTGLRTKSTDTHFDLVS